MTSVRVVLRLRGFLSRAATVLFALAAADLAIPTLEMAAPSKGSAQRQIRLRFLSWRVGETSSAAVAARAWVVYAHDDTVLLVVDGPVAESGNSLRIDAFVQGSPWEKQVQGLPISAADTLGSWRVGHSRPLPGVSTMQGVRGGHLLLTLLPQEFLREMALPSDLDVTRIRAVLTTPNGHRVTATLRTSFAI